MLVTGDDIPVAYDRFRHRIMFPITDLRGRVIAFGGRALDPEAPAKYLNSPETPLFHKGAMLYNAHNARGPAHDKGQMIVGRGLHGRDRAVAKRASRRPWRPSARRSPRTRSQLLWRMAPEPILCFDGDAAGRRAAFRAVETVLPHLKPGFSVQFAFLPDGARPRRSHPPARRRGVPGDPGKQDLAPVRRADRARGAAGRARRHARAARLPRGAPQGARRAHRRPRRARASTSASCGRRCGRRTAS